MKFISTAHKMKVSVSVAQSEGNQGLDQRQDQADGIFRLRCRLPHTSACGATDSLSLLVHRSIHESDGRGWVGEAWSRKKLDSIALAIVLSDSDTVVCMLAARF